MTVVTLLGLHSLCRESSAADASQKDPAAAAGSASSMRLYNTMSGKKEPFTLRDSASREVLMYVVRAHADQQWHSAGALFPATTQQCGLLLIHILLQPHLLLQANDVMHCMNGLKMLWTTRMRGFSNELHPNAASVCCNRSNPNPVYTVQCGVTVYDFSHVGKHRL